ncbi:MAG: hypothetical protein AAFQ87_23075 [Bacteroidota bacterium]
MKNKNKIAGLAFTGCMFVGMGLGYFFKSFNAGMFIGMGVGFVFSAIIRYSAMEDEHLQTRNEQKD